MSEQRPLYPSKQTSTKPIILNADLCPGSHDSRAKWGSTGFEGSVELRSNQHSDKTWSNGKRFTMQFIRWQRFRVLTILGIVGIGSLALIYFIPAPPSKVVMATAFKGASFEYYGRQYQEIFARSHVELELRETAGAVENLKLLQNPNSDVQIAFVTGGLSDAKHEPGVLSLGTVYEQPFWIFYPANEQFDQLAQLKGKRIAVGPVGSATRHTAEQVLGKVV
jgi:NMT1 family protein